MFEYSTMLHVYCYMYIAIIMYIVIGALFRTPARQNRVTKTVERNKLHFINMIKLVYSLTCEISAGQSSSTDTECRVQSAMGIN